MKLIYKHIIFIAVCLVHTAFLYAQKINFTKIQESFSKDDYVKVKQELAKVDTTKVDEYGKATWLFYNANYNSKLDSQHIAYKSILKAKQLYVNLNKTDDVIDCNILLLEILSHQNNLELNTNNILEELEISIQKEGKIKKAKTIYNQIAIKYFDLKNAKEAIKYFKKAIATNPLDSLILGRMYVNIGVTYSHILKNNDSALFYYKKSEPLLVKYKKLQTLSANYNNQGISYQNKKEYEQAIIFYKKADALPLKTNIAKTKLVYFDNLATVYKLKKDYQRANLYLKKHINLKDSINDVNQNVAIAKSKEQFDNEKLRANNLEIEHEKNRVENFLITTSIILFLGGFTSFLVYKNNIKKQQIIKAEKFFEKQKVANLLKEQELITIDAIISGQEKERQIIASDLHDDLGALMATLQFNFENLYKYRDSEDAERLFVQTKSLIKKAYKKIRTIANVKKSGVIAEKGLLKAVTKNARKISKLSNIKIDVKPHGLINRLDNQLELVLFRIIQELMTNIIKHAQATEANIHLTCHKQFLNIMVEDNGVGFEIKTISNSDGMGISSIEKKVESLGGTIIIESLVNKGTAIIIDIPT